MKQELWLGDCLDLMPQIPDKSVDMILCDLPYGTTACKWDVIIPFDKLWGQYERIIKNNGSIVLFGGQPFTSKLILSNEPLFKYELIWHKTRNSFPFFAKIRPLPQHENILVFYKNRPTYNPQKIKSEKSYKINKNTSGRTSGEKKGREWNGESVTSNERLPNSVLIISNPSRECGLHPTQKPVELCEYLIKTYTNEGDLVLDNCAGSGSTLIAAKNLNRQFIGIEKEEKYFNIAKERLKN